MTKEQVEAMAEPQAAEVLAAWVKAKRSELPTALIGSSSKAHAKLAKKALYQLQSAGVQTEASKPEGAPVNVESAPTEFEAVLSMQLGSGERAFLGAIPIRGGGIEVFTGLVHDELGIAQIGSERSNRGNWRKHMLALKNDKKTRHMVVPFSRLQLELNRALWITRETKTDLETNIEEGLSRLGITPVDPNFALPPMEAGDAEGGADGAELFKLFEFEQWLPSEKDLAALAQQVEAVKILPLDEAAKTEKSLKICRDLAAEVFTPTVRTLYARRLVYAAELLEKNGSAADAKRVLAEARRLAHGTTPSAFAEQLFIKALPNLPKTAAAQLGLKK